MSLITIVEAANQFKVSRSRIYRAIAQGKLTTQRSSEGVIVVQATDMVRLFSSKSKQPVKRTAEQERTAPTIQDGHLIELLTEQLKQAQEREQFYKQEIANIRQDFSDYKLAITHKTELHSYDAPEQEKQSDTGSDNVRATTWTSAKEQQETPQTATKIMKSILKRFM